MDAPSLSDWAVAYLRRVKRTSSFGGLPIPAGVRTMGMTRLEDLGLIEDRAGRHCITPEGIAALQAAEEKEAADA